MTTAQQKMDDAAEDARQELQSKGVDEILVVAAWIKKNYLHAGYKRLCKVLMEEAGVK